MLYLNDKRGMKNSVNCFVIYLPRRAQFRCSICGCHEGPAYQQFSRWLLRHKRSSDLPKESHSESVSPQWDQKLSLKPQSFALTKRPHAASLSCTCQNRNVGRNVFVLALKKKVFSFSYRFLGRCRGQNIPSFQLFPNTRALTVCVII